MNKRIRKKHRLGEFQEHGFLFRVTFRGETTASERDAALGDLIDLIESRGLIVGGSGNGVFDGFVAPDPDRPGTVSPETRAEFERWLAERPELSGAEVGELIDAWHELPFAVTARLG